MQNFVHKKNIIINEITIYINRRGKLIFLFSFNKKYSHKYKMPSQVKNQDIKLVKNMLSTVDNLEGKNKTDYYIQILEIILQSEILMGNERFIDFIKEKTTEVLDNDLISEDTYYYYMNRFPVF